MQPLQARIDLGAMAMKGCCAFTKAWMKPHHQSVLCPIQDTRCRGLTSLQRMKISRVKQTIKHFEKSTKMKKYYQKIVDESSWEESTQMEKWRKIRKKDINQLLMYLWNLASSYQIGFSLIILPTLGHVTVSI